MKDRNFNRRRFIRNTGFGVLAFNVAGAEALLTPRDAYARQIPLTVLSDAQASLLGEFGEALLPGARAAGLVHFVDLQLSRDPQECLLMCKYFPGIDPPYAEFYGGGLEGLTRACAAVYGQDFGALGDPQRNQLIDTLWSDEVAGWTGPPATDSRSRGNHPCG